MRTAFGTNLVYGFAGDIKKDVNHNFAVEPLNCGYDFFCDAFYSRARGIPCSKTSRARADAGFRISVATVLL